MSALSIQVPFPVFQDRDGQPLDNGYVWIGTANLYPITNAVPVFFDAALTIPAAQPLRTINGYISNSGTPAQVYVNGLDYSILVQDSKGSMVYNFPQGTGIDADVNAEVVVYDPPFIDAVQTNVEAKLAQYVSVKDFGAVGNGVTDDTAAIQAALDASRNVYFPAGNYIISDSLKLSNHHFIRGSGTSDFLSGETPSTSNIKNTRIFQTSANPVFVTINASINDRAQIHISDLTVQGRIGTTDIGTYGVYGLGMTQLHLTNFEAFFFTNAGVYIAAAEKNNLNNCNIQYCQDAGVILDYQLPPPPPDTTAYGAYATNIIGGVIRQNGNASIHLKNVQVKVNIIGVIFESNGRFFPGNGYGIFLDGETRNTTIQGCWFEGTAGTPIVVGAFVPAINTVPNNTVIRDCEFWSVFGGSPGTKLQFNAGVFHTIENCVFFGGGVIEIKSKSDSPKIISCYGKGGDIVIKDVNDNSVPFNVVSKTNKFPQGQQISAWTPINCVITVDSTQTSPAGSLIVYKITPSAAGLVRITAPAISSANTWLHTFKTISCYIKTDSDTNLKFNWGVAIGADVTTSAVVNTFEVTKQWSVAQIGRSTPSSGTGTYTINLTYTATNTDPFYVTAFGAFDGIVNEPYKLDTTEIIALNNSATPTVYGITQAVTGGTTTITDFVSGSVGQTLTLIAEHVITITDGTNIFLAGSTNFAMNPTDVLTCIQKADGKWYEISRSDNT